jgi:hypothetical protein
MRDTSPRLIKRDQPDADMLNYRFEKSNGILLFSTFLFELFRNCGKNIVEFIKSLALFFPRKTAGKITIADRIQKTGQFGVGLLHITDQVPDKCRNNDNSRNRRKYKIKAVKQQPGKQADRSRE